jgi:hypothetical protein
MAPSGQLGMQSSQPVHFSSSMVMILRFIVRASFVKVKRFFALLFVRMPELGYKHLDPSQEIAIFFMYGISPEKRGGRPSRKSYCDPLAEGDRALRRMGRLFHFFRI